MNGLTKKFLRPTLNKKNIARHLQFIMLFAFVGGITGDIYQETGNVLITLAVSISLTLLVIWTFAFGDWDNNLEKQESLGRLARLI